MRAVAVTLGLTLIAFAGCIGDDAGTDSETGHEEDQMEADLSQMPERRFEPQLVFEAVELEIQKADNVELSFAVTDMHDYPFPETFIDWLLIYEREPNPVHEGDATQLPGEWNRTLHAEDYHMFLFRADDGQGFLDREVVIVKVGEPTVAYPTDEEIQAFIDDVERTYGKLEGAIDEATGEVISAAPDPCAGVPVQEPIEATEIILTAGAGGSGNAPRYAFTIEECQKVVDITVSNLYADTILALNDPDGTEVARSDDSFVGGETLRYAPGEPLVPGEWNVRFFPFAGGPDEYQITIKFE